MLITNSKFFAILHWRTLFSNYSTICPCSLALLLLKFSASLGCSFYTKYWPLTNVPPGVFCITQLFHVFVALSQVFLNLLLTPNSKWAYIFYKTNVLSFNVSYVAWFYSQLNMGLNDFQITTFCFYTLVSFAASGDTIKIYARKHADIYRAPVGAACQGVSNVVLM